MADRYWVGGTGTWNTTSTTNWSASSGGPSGASVPTVADSVFFDQAATYTVTMTGALACLDITVSAGTVTFATGSGPSLNVRGSMSLIAGTVWSSTGAITFSSVATGRTITTNGTTLFGAVTFDGVGGGWTLGSAFTTTGPITVTNGSFATAGYSLTATQISSSNSNTRTIDLGASTATLSGSAAINFATNTNLTFNAGTSTIVCTPAFTNVTGGTTNVSGVTFYNISFTSTSPGATISANIIGVNTFNNFSVTAPSVAGLKTITFDSRTTINGALSTTSTAGNRRILFCGATTGLAQTLTVNAAPSLTDADFRDIYVVGTAAPISGTRIGNLPGCRGITFSAPKAVFWNLPAGGNWTATAWAAYTGGPVSDDNFPLAQDIAVIANTGLNTSATVTFNNAITHTGTLDFSTRTLAMTFTTTGNPNICGDLKLNSTITVGSGTLVFIGRKTQTVITAGRTITGGFNIDSIGGIVQLGDALTVSNNITFINGTFNTANYSVTSQFGAIVFNNPGERVVNLESSTVTTPTITFSNTNGVTFNPGTSQVNITGTGTFTPAENTTFNNISFTATSSGPTVSAQLTCNNLTVTAPAANGYKTFTLSANITVTGTLTLVGASPTRRIWVRSNTIGTPRTITAATISATDCDFRDITLAGTAVGTATTRTGDLGGNTGITFPAAKTVYWNLAGSQNWSATAWATGSGGTPDVNNFPLAQDTAVFDNTGAVGTVTFEAAWNVGAVNMGARTSAMTLTTSGSPVVYGNWTFGTGVTSSNTGSAITFSSRSTQTITSNGVSFNCPVTIDSFFGTAQLADALSLGSNRGLTVITGTFDAVSYNVTAGNLSTNYTSIRTIRMGSGTWTITGTGTVWDATTATNLSVVKGSSNIVLSSTSGLARTFTGNTALPKLTIGGTTGTSTLTIVGNQTTFDEIASTKTVAHTISFSSNLAFGKWTVTGTAGNVVTLSGSASLTVAGAAVSGVDYLSIAATLSISSISPGEFYAGANSTGTGSGFILTAAPASRTLYWVGGTGNWSSTTRWSTSSGGGSGAAVPTSLDDVVFDSASNATAYTATIDPTQARCRALTIAGPASGNVTIAGSGGIACHGNISFATTGITRTYTGTATLSGSSTGRTFDSGTVVFRTINVNGVGCGWSLTRALNVGSNTFSIISGSFDTAGYAFTCSTLNFSSTQGQEGTLTLGASTISLISLASSSGPNFTLNAGTSQINFDQGGASFNGGGRTYYNVSFVIGNIAINGANTFNNLTVNAPGLTTMKTLSLGANQTINGTLTINSSADATARVFLRSDTVGTTRTLTCAAVSLQDVDFRDITIAGAAAPASGTRLGNARNNSGITFDTPKTVYWNLAGAQNWSATGWATSSGGAPAVNNFPLAQDTAVFDDTGSVTGTITINAANGANDVWLLGSVNMLNRTSAMTLASGSLSPFVYGNWSNGTGTTLTGTGTITFAGRGSQTITSSGKTFPQLFDINSPGGSVTLQDALTLSNSSASALTLTAGTFDANGYNVTLSSGGFSSANTNVRTVAVGSGTWTIGGSGTAWATFTTTNLTVTGTGTLSFTSASTKTFSNGSFVSYAGITVNQGGAGTLSIQSSGTFYNITNTYSATGATAISFGSAVTVSQFTASGASGNLLTISGSNLNGITLSSGFANVDYLRVNTRGLPLGNTFYAGSNSVNLGSLGWYFEPRPTSQSASVFEYAIAYDALSPSLRYARSVSETSTVTDVPSARQRCAVVIIELGTGTDSISAEQSGPPSSIVPESATGSDVVSARVLFGSLLSETATGIDLVRGGNLFIANIAETGSAVDLVASFQAYFTNLLETATGSDTVSSRFVVSGAVAETATGTDTPSSNPVYNRTVTDSATVTDVASAALTYLRSVSETATAADVISTVQGYFSQIAETATGTDAPLVAPSTFNAPVVETATATDNFSARAVFYASVTTTVTIGDTVVARFLWEPIDDTQTANWQNIPNTQAGNWQTIPNTQTSGWTIINTLP